MVDAKWALFEVYGEVWLMLNGLCLRCMVQLMLNAFVPNIIECYSNETLRM